ncbi:MAG: GTP-binding protein, partial [Glaciecola sp.]
HAQLECADRVLINRLLPAALDRITARIKPSCEVGILEKIKSTETQMQPLVTPQTNSRQNVGKLARQIHQGKITSVSFSDLKLHDKDKFNTILLAYRAVVLRAKGYVCWQGQSYLVQLSGAKIAWSKLPSPPKRFDFVVIGKQGDVFDECMTQLSKESELL